MSSLEGLPLTVCLKIFRLLTPEDLLAATRVCSSWRRLVNKEFSIIPGINQHFWQRWIEPYNCEVFQRLIDEGRVVKIFIKLHFQFIKRFCVVNSRESSFGSAVIFCCEKVAQRNPGQNWQICRSSK